MYRFYASDIFLETGTPKELQVSATINSHFDSPFGQVPMSIRLLVPSRAYELIPVEISLEPSEPLGIYVTVNGLKDQSLAEMTRRGGFLSICGKIWAQSGGIFSHSLQLTSNLTDTFERLANI
jgi:hypothetical protein